MPEISEEEFLQNQKLRSTVAALLSNPKSKKLVQQAHRIVDPKAVAPELDTEEAIREPLDAVSKQIAELAKSIADDKAQAETDRNLAALHTRFESGRAKLREKKYTAEGIEAIEKMMQEKGIVDHEDAAVLFDKMHPPPAPSMPGRTGSWNFVDAPTGDGADDIKKLIETKGESDALVHKMANDALNDIRGQRR